jgi:hypothetical protein
MKLTFESDLIWHVFCLTKAWRHSTPEHTRLFVISPEC